MDDGIRSEWTQACKEITDMHDTALRDIWDTLGRERWDTDTKQLPYSNITKAEWCELIYRERNRRRISHNHKILQLSKLNWDADGSLAAEGWLYVPRYPSDRPCMLLGRLDHDGVAVVAQDNSTNLPMLGHICSRIYPNQTLDQFESETLGLSVTELLRGGELDPIMPLDRGWADKTVHDIENPKTN